MLSLRHYSSKWSDISILLDLFRFWNPILSDSDVHKMLNSLILPSHFPTSFVFHYRKDHYWIRTCSWICIHIGYNISMQAYKWRMGQKLISYMQQWEHHNIYRFWTWNCPRSVDLIFARPGTFSSSNDHKEEVERPGHVQYRRLVSPFQPRTKIDINVRFLHSACITSMVRLKFLVTFANSEDPTCNSPASLASCSS